MPPRYPPPDDQTVLRALMRLGRRGVPRTAFLREASKSLLQRSGADALLVWIEDGPDTLVWSAVGTGSPRVDFDPIELEGPPRSLLARALEASSGAGSLMRTAGGSAWIASVDDPEAGRFALSECGSLALLPFEIDEEHAGVLQLESTSPNLFDAERTADLENLAQLFGVAIASRRAQAARGERVKELACMYRIAQIGAEAGKPLERMLGDVAQLLPPAWQYPEITSARITLEGQAFTSQDFAQGAHRLASDITVRGEPSGAVEVFYQPREADPEHRPLLERDPFLPEERHLIDGVARELGFIIERKRAEEDTRRLQDQVRHADRLATIGQLAAGVAHELNEPLGNVLGFAQLALKAPDVPRQTQRDLEHIVDASLYAREVIKKLMFFARQGPSKKTRLELHPVISDSTALLASRCDKARVTVEVELGEDLPPLLGDRAQIQQVVVNLMVNAIQAMPDGGVLRLSTSPHEMGARLTVEDSGLGIADENLDKLFVPFFTTKDVGEGTGLGLSVVHGIVTAHGGEVHVSSCDGEGTRFEVLLPAAPDETGASSDA